MSVSPPVIYLDMDGVCCDFNAAALRLHGRIPDVEISRWEKSFPGEFHPYRVLGIDRNAFWQPIHEAGADFWAALEPYPWFDSLLAGLKARGRVVFLSSGTWDARCLEGKLRWLQTRFGRDFSDYVFTPRKELLAGPRAILVDDYPANVAAFTAAHGCGVLFPQPWNGPQPSPGDRLNRIFLEIDRVLGRH